MPQALVSGKKNISPNVSIFFFTRETSACGKCSNPVYNNTNYYTTTSSFKPNNIGNKL